MWIVIKLCNEGHTELNSSKKSSSCPLSGKRLSLEVGIKWSEIKRKGVPHTVFN